MQHGQLHIRGFVARVDGSDFIHASAVGDADDPEAVGQMLADQLLRRGARAVLDAVTQV